MDHLSKIGVDEGSLVSQVKNTTFWGMVVIAKSIIYLADTISKAIADAATKISGRMP